MRKDSLATLTRLRAIETTQAQAELARTGAARQDAAARAEEAARRVHSESDTLSITYGTWLSAQLALRQRARAAEAAATAEEERARLALVEARRAERTVELLVEARQAEEKRLAMRREAAALDEIAAQRRRTGQR